MSFFIPTAAAGNGRTLATFGRSGEIMGFFYPRLDFAQNVREGMPAIRLANGSPQGHFLWCFHEAWRVAQSFEPASNVLITRLAHRDLDLSLELTDIVPPQESALIRRIVLTKGPGVGPVQFMHYFRLGLGDSAIRNGVVIHPEEKLVLQHYRDIAIALTASEPFSGMCSSTRYGAESPTKHAMMSGNLGSIHQAIGRVDFAAAFEPVRENRWHATIVLAGATSPEAAGAAAVRLARQPTETAVQQVGSRVAAELADAGPCTVPELSDAYERAVISLHDLFDEQEGAFLAAPEFDPGYELSGGYGYCWPRDAAVCALAMEQIGHPSKARRFFEWAARTQLASGHWYQRYWLDGSPAPSWCIHDHVIQLDQTCAMVQSAGILARRLAESGDDAVGFIESYRPTAEQATRAILEYIGPNALHRTATDLWENSIGAFAYTQAGIIAALREAHDVFRIEPQRTGPDVQSRLREKLVATFWDADRRRWLRRVTPSGEPDRTLDSSAMGIVDPWKVLDLSDPYDRILAFRTLDGIGESLRSPVKGGGAILRFEGESYMGGGPGCVNTLWLAVCRLRLAETAASPEERRQQRELALQDIRVALANTSPTGQLPELIPKIRFDYWAAPHGWACSLLIAAVQLLKHLEPPPGNVFEAERSQVRRKAPSR